MRLILRFWRGLGPLPLIAALALLLPACAARQDNASADLLDPANSARQEFVADVQFNAGRLLLAVRGYDKALVARPGDVGLLVKKGQALLRLNRLDESLEAFRLAVAASPESSGAHYGAGQASERLGRRDEARQSFERAVALAPGSWRARCHLGVLFMNQGQPDKAEEQFLAALATPRFQAQAVAQAGTSSGAQAVPGREELLNNLAVAQVLAGRPETAVKTFRLAMQGSRDPERSANNLGLLLVRLGRPAEALDAFRAGGSDARALNNLGYALYLQGEVVRAQALFEKALDLSPAYYVTAGENLKQAVGGAPAAPTNIGLGAGQSAGSPGEAAAQGRPKDRGHGVSTTSEAAPRLDLERLSLTGRDGEDQHFGQARLLGEGAGRQWAY
ncbi:MAG: tetratricopeptide repeat protein [Proteobacteria bacterium]|nr:tetratricopeptide repeat protein [Pseudomonadota bacterium]